MKIEELSPELEAYLPKYREEIRARGIRLQWATDEEIRQSVLDLYAAAGLEKPSVIVLDSPLACLAARTLLKRLMKDGGQLEDQLEDQLRDQLSGQLSGQLWGQLRGTEIEFVPTYYAGGSEFYWAAFYEFCGKSGAKYSDQQSRWLDAWLNYADKAGALYPYDGLAFVSRRPASLSFDENRVLHSEVGPAMAFNDGFSLHCWHGVRVPEEWITKTNELTANEILSCRNVEQRAAGVAIKGMDKMLDSLRHEIIDSDEDPERGDLIKVFMTDLPEPGFYLKAHCPRNGTIMEAVNPDEMEELTVKGAQAWRVGIPVSEYAYPTKRT